MIERDETILLRVVGVHHSSVDSFAPYILCQGFESRAHHLCVFDDLCDRLCDPQILLFVIKCENKQN